jgi:hypothetical protein
MQIVINYIISDLRIYSVFIDGGYYENNKNIIELETFIKENSRYWDLNLPDVKDFIVDNKDELIKILQRL